jgi:4-hydroxybenzoate polyprenyltransferase
MDNARVRREELSGDAEEASGDAPMRSGALAGLWAALRPTHWMKNLLVLAPVLFSENLFNPRALSRGAFAFSLFCLVSSSGYLINDVQDLEQDRRHPLKSRRPLALGRLSVATALTAAICLLLAGLSGALLLGRAFALSLLAYALVTLAYTFLLKRQVILDVFAIAAGFVLRAVAGAVAIEVEMSSWLLICTTLLALFLGFSKRRSELLLLKGEAGSHRQVLDEYNPLFLDMMIGIVTASTVMSYLLYTISEETVRHFQTKNLLLTLPFVLYGIFRYLYLVYHRQRGGDPLETAFNDPATLINLLLWTATVTLILYWR